LQIKIKKETLKQNKKTFKITMKLKVILTGVLAAIVIALAFVLYFSITKPVKYDNEYNRRSNEVIAKLKDIRTLQEQFRMTNGRYCNSIDSLLDFAENGQAKIVKKFGTVPDSLTEAEAIKAGIVKREIVTVNPLEKLYSEGKLLTPKDKIKDLKYIPYSNHEVFTMSAGSINKGGIDVSVFEAKAPVETYTYGMDKQMTINKKADLKAKENGYAGWKVGDLEQAITNGNWE
jgi:hypothetical protein